MATQYMTESRYPQMQLPSGFSIVVDDVDGDREDDLMALAEAPSPGLGAAADAAELVEEAQEALEALVSCECGSSHDRRGSRDSRSGREPLDAQLCSERIRQIQVEAQSRKNEFAKLLEEHAQVVLRVKQMEQRELQLQHTEDHPATQDHPAKQDQARTSRNDGGM
ncbi:Imidazole glycerol phosphate synthase subunit HisF [Frankliniella fusca]|uniref:Imidazole glycerol phosphate synthase subunit HisF n=1 Tax=Frankliniella fusca TaxID=407009 RepID=A0AAE1LDK7_9NEOP|nr:Imidazole glycerol phosphate synthase subunit HisF [Frankliniella fusca]